jgi:flavin reductase (DIM6/NTAB) family NADH-FMN oxidoreductase RutF
MSDAKNIAQLMPALGRVSSGVYILTARHGEQETGMLASWVMQAGFDPPMLSVAVHRDRYLVEWLSAGAPFAINIVAKGQKPLLSHFGRGFPPEEYAFEGIAIERDTAGVPVLAEPSLGYLSCTPGASIESADHHIYLAEVIGGKLFSEEQPMIHLRKTGAHY